MTGTLDLTPNQKPHAAGAAWTSSPVSVAQGFTTLVNLSVGQSSAGVALVIQNSTAGNDAISSSNSSTLSASCAAARSPDPHRPL